jgi:hypothetical protein
LSSGVAPFRLRIQSRLGCNSPDIRCNKYFHRKAAAPGDV